MKIGIHGKGVVEAASECISTPCSPASGRHAGGNTNTSNIFVYHQKSPGIEDNGIFTPRIF